MNIQNSIVAEDTPTVKRPGRFRTFLYKRRWFALFVALPVLIATFYYAFIASDLYVSESRFVIKTPGQRQVQFSALANLIQTSGLTTGQQQANEVMDYLQSRSALSDLQKRINVRARFMGSEADFLSRFPAPWDEDAFEDLYKYFGKRAGVRIDGETGVVVLEVKAFTAKDARDINSEMLNLGEGIVNRLNVRAQGRAISENEKRLVEAESRVRNARIALRRFRNAEALYDPNKQAVGVLEVTNRLVAEQASLLAQLEMIERVAPDNPSISALRARISSIGNQIAAQTGRTVGPSSGIASKLGKFEDLAEEQEFATQMMAATNTGLEQARTEAQKQQFYLERVVEPNLPDLPLLPNRLTQILTVLAVSLCLYLIGWMLIVGILEHSPED